MAPREGGGDSHDVNIDTLAARVVVVVVVVVVVLAYSTTISHSILQLQFKNYMI